MVYRSLSDTHLARKPAETKMNAEHIKTFSTNNANEVGPRFNHLDELAYNYIEAEAKEAEVRDLKKALSKSDSIRSTYLELIQALSGKIANLRHRIKVLKSRIADEGGWKKPTAAPAQEDGS